MGTSIQAGRSHRKIQVGATTKRKAASPIDKAKAYEVIWPNVSALFDAARSITNPSFVYFIGEPDGPIKIGVSKDPVARLRAMQTGNPRRLKIEQVLLGTADTEKLLHEMWEAHTIYSKRSKQRTDAAPGTEWFTADVRPLLLPVVATAAEHQRSIIAAAGDIDETDLQRAVRAAHGQHGIAAHKPDEVRLLASTIGYTSPTRRSRI